MHQSPERSVFSSHHLKALWWHGWLDSVNHLQPVESLPSWFSWMEASLTSDTQKRNPFIGSVGTNKQETQQKDRHSPVVRASFPGSWFSWAGFVSPLGRCGKQRKWSIKPSMNPVFKVGWARYFNLFLFLSKHGGKPEKCKQKQGAIYMSPAEDHRKISNSFRVLSFQFFLYISVAKDRICIFRVCRLDNFIQKFVFSPCTCHI